MVETGFSKNGRVTFSPVGARPIWIYTLDGYGGYSLHSSEAPAGRCGSPIRTARR
jgi:hypothetical protein